MTRRIRGVLHIVNLATAIAQFLKYMQVERNASPNTLRGYACVLGQFNKFGSIDDVGGIKTGDIRAWLYSLNVVPKTLSHRIAAIKSLFKFLVEQEIIASNPAGVIKYPKVEARLPEFLQAAEVEKLLSNNHCSGWIGKRNRAIVVLLVMTGIRRAELGNLNLTDCVFHNGEKHNGSIRVRGKGMKERAIPLHDLASRVMQEYLEARPDDSGAVFVSARGQRICTDTIRLIVRKGCRTAGIKIVSPHKLRHTFATMLHEADVDVVEISRLLGHSDINTTMIYTHTSNWKLEDAVNKLKINGEGENGSHKGE